MTSPNPAARTLGWCECEHISHLGPPLPGPRAGHEYMTVPAATVVKTMFGEYALCQHCADEHLTKPGR